MSDVLVLYVDPFGPTAQVAMQVAEQLCRRGLRVELRRVSRATTSGCPAVVLGGATSAERWDPAALEYLRQVDDRTDLHLFHTAFTPAREPASVPYEVRRLADARGVGRIPVLLDDDGQDPALPAAPRPLGLRPLPPALRWADVLADQLRLNRERMALAG